MGQDQSKRSLLAKARKMATGGPKLKQVTDDNTVLQWVHKIASYSSQYDPVNWCADQVIGPPKVYPQYGDIHGAWAPKKIDDNQYLELEFEEAVFVTGIDIYETYHSGGVKTIKGYTESGSWQTLWKSPRIENQKSSRIFSPPLAEMGCRTRRIRLDIDCTACGTWVEIDAVQLHGKVFLTAPPPSMDELAADYAKIVNEKEYSDVTFLVQDRPVYGHKAILCARSDYFRALFSKRMREGRSQVADGSEPPSYDEAVCDGSEKGACLYPQEPVKLVDVNYDALLAVLQFLYTNKLPATLDSISLTHLWRVADRFNMEGLMTLAVFNISERINESNVVDTYVAATDSLPIIDEVRDNCITFMSSNMSKIVNTKSFTSLPQGIMLEIIQKATCRLQL